MCDRHLRRRYSVYLRDSKLYRTPGNGPQCCEVRFRISYSVDDHNDQPRRTVHKQHSHSSPFYNCRDDGKECSGRNDDGQRQRKMNSDQRQHDQ